MPRIDFPRQKLSRRKKTQKWGEECIEAGLGLVGIYDHTRRSSRFKKKRNYDLYNGKFDKQDLEYVTDPLGLGSTAELPATLQYYDVVSPIFNLLFGEEAKRTFSVIVRSINEEAITSKESEKKNRVVGLFKGIMQAAVEELTQGQQAGSPQEQQAILQQAQQNIPEELKRIEKYFDYDYQDMNESTANKLLNYLERQQHLKVKFAKGWEDALIAGEEIYCIEEVSNEPTVRRVNPLEFYCLLPHNDDYVDNADVIVEDTFMSINTVLDNFYEDLSPSQIDKLEKEQGNRGTVDSKSIVNYPNPEKLYIQNREGTDNNDSNLFNYYDQDGNIRVTKVVWKSMRKVGKLTYFDELGLKQERVVDESYQPNTEVGESISYMWINEYWEGTKIGQDTYINIQVRPQQFRHMDNLSICSSGYVGTIYNANNAQSVSLMDRLVPWIYMYITLWYRLELAIAANQGKIALIDLSLIPDGWEIEKWMYYAQSMKFGFVDSFNEGKKGQSTGKLAGNISTQNKVIDMETGNFIQQHIQLLEFTESKIQSLSGVTKQRMGAISSSELVGNTERAVVQSSHITEKWYEVHNNTKVRVMEALLNVAKDTYRGETKRFQYMTDEFANVFFKLNGDDFVNSEYGLFISNSSRDNMAIEALKQLTHAALQNDKMTLSDVVQIYNASSLADLRKNLEKAEKNYRQIQAQVQQQQQEVQQQQNQMQVQMQLEKENREDARNSQDNETKIEIARMNMQSKGEDRDLNNNQVRDDIDLAKVQLEREKLQVNRALKERELNIKDKNAKA